MLNPIGIALATSFLAAYGASDVAAFGAATRIEAFAAIPMLAMSAAIGPIAGQNWGRGKPGRIGEALRRAFVVSLAWAAACTLAAWLFAPALAASFSADVAVQARIAEYLRIVASSLAGYGVLVIAAACCNAVGYSLAGAVLYVARMLVLYVPLTFVAAEFSGITTMFWAIWIANAAAGVLAYVLVFRVLARCAADPQPRPPDGEATSPAPV